MMIDEQAATEFQRKLFDYWLMMPKWSAKDAAILLSMRQSPDSLSEPYALPISEEARRLLFHFARFGLVKSLSNDENENLVIDAELAPPHAWVGCYRDFPECRPLPFEFKNGDLDACARAIAKTQTVSITNIILGVSAASNGAVTIPEVADAINRKEIYDGGAMMIYRGDGYGLAEPIASPFESTGYNRRVDTITELFNVQFWDNPNATVSRIPVESLLVSKADGAEIARRLWFYFFPDTELPAFDDLLNGEPTAAASVRDAKIAPSLAVRGDTFARLQRAITAFPVRYPEYETKPPKLDVDIRPWLKEIKAALNDREAHVFGAIIREHFELLPDTQKSA